MVTQDFETAYRIVQGVASLLHALLPNFAPEVMVTREPIFGTLDQRRVIVIRMPEPGGVK